MSDLPVRRRRRAASANVGIDPELAEEIRARYISHEMSVRSIALLYFVHASFYIVMSIAGLVEIIHGKAADSKAAIAIAVFFLGVLSAGYIQAGRMLRRLDPAVRSPAIILSALGTLVVPVGTIIHGYALYLLLSIKGERILSKKYNRIILATPHQARRTSIIVWGFIGLLTLVMAFLLAAGLFVIITGGTKR